LPYTLRGARVTVEAAAQDVFLQLFRWGPGLLPDSNLEMLVVRAIARTVERLSKPPRSSWAPRKGSRRSRSDATFDD
jgi:hypothetical protein